MTFLLDVLCFVIPVAIIASGSLLRRRALLDPKVAAQNDAKNIGLYQFAGVARAAGWASLWIGVCALPGGVAAGLLMALIAAGIAFDIAAGDRSDRKTSWTRDEAAKSLMMTLFASDLNRAALLNAVAMCWVARFSGMIHACGWVLSALLCVFFVVGVLWRIVMSASDSISRFTSVAQTGVQPPKEFTRRQKDQAKELINASRAGDETQTATLLRAGALPAAPDMFGGNALMAAARAGQAHCVSLMLGVNGGVEAARAKDSGSSTALLEAVHGRVSSLTDASARGGYLECVQILLPASDLHAEDNWKRTALMWAVDDVECVKAILAKDSSTALDANKEGMTALMFAAQMGDKALDAIELLLPCSNVMATDRDGRTALAHAASAGRSLAIVKRLAAAASLAGSATTLN